MPTTPTSRSTGTGLCGLLLVAFVVLKLCGVIHWSWWWVTLPLWGPIAVGILLLAILGLLAVIGVSK